MGRVVVFAMIALFASSAYAFHDGECRWHRIPQLPDYFNKLSVPLKIGESVYGITLEKEKIIAHPMFSYALYLERHFKIKKDKQVFPFEDIVMRYFFPRPTSNKNNRYSLVEVAWFSAKGEKYFWNKWLDENKLPGYIDFYNPYFMTSVPCGSLQ